MSVLLPTDHAEETPHFTKAQWWLFSVTGASSLFTLGWPIGDFIYQHQFTVPKSWLVSLLVCVAAWVVTVVRLGQEKLMRDNRTIIHNQQSINEYLDGLATGIDAYGDAREVQGHRLAAMVKANGRAHLHSVD